MAKRVFIVAAKRTAFGAYGGKLKGWTATEMCTHATKAALSAGGVNPEAVDTCIVGNVAQVGSHRWSQRPRAGRANGFVRAIARRPRQTRPISRGTLP